jgi:Spy/CpxP family protein refolding chaperone
MRRTMVLLTLGAVLVGAFALLAQGPRNQPGKGMMGRGGGMGMMGSMMQEDPLRSSILTAFALPEMQSELGLSTQQVTQLRQMKQDLLHRGEEISKQIASKNKELQAAVSKGTSSDAQVKQLLEEIAKLRAQQEFAGYETAGKMKAALTGAQRSKFDALRPLDFHQALMSHMTMQDMAKMMQFMGGGGGMMSGGMMGMMHGMMGGGMMGPGMMGGMTMPEPAPEKR